MPRLILNRRNSGQIVKFFVKFLEVTTVETRLNGVTFLTKTNAEFGNLVTTYTIRDIPDFASISKYVESWKGILKKITSALSTSNGFNSDLEVYFNEVESKLDT